MDGFMLSALETAFGVILGIVTVAFVKNGLVWMNWSGPTLQPIGYTATMSGERLAATKLLTFYGFGVCKYDVEDGEGGYKRKIGGDHVSAWKIGRLAFIKDKEPQMMFERKAG